MSKPLSPATMAIVKSTAPALKQHGETITKRMYERLFRFAEIEEMFDAANFASGEQPRRLAAAILAYAQNIDRLEALSGAIEHIVARHVDVGVRPEHYPMVAEALIPAIRDVLGEAATDEVLDAWAQAYWFLAEMLIGLESNRYLRLAA